MPRPKMRWNAAMIDALKQLVRKVHRPSNVLNVLEFAPRLCSRNAANLASANA